MATEKIAGTKAVAQRLVNAHENFIAVCGERGFTAAEADHILNVYKKAKAVKLNISMGRYDFKHGVFLDADVMRNALAM